MLRLYETNDALAERFAALAAALKDGAQRPGQLAELLDLLDAVKNLAMR